MNLIENPEQARRLARAILSDVAIYNREKVEAGIKNDNLFDLLTEELEEGRQHYNSRVAPQILRAFLRSGDSRCPGQESRKDRIHHLVIAGIHCKGEAGARLSTNRAFAFYNERNERHTKSS